MAYDESLADRVREALAHLPDVQEKAMFSGLAFLVDGKMCVNVSGEELMIRFDPALQEELAGENGFRLMIMKGKKLRGYGYIDPGALKSKKALERWIGLALDFNPRARSSKARK